MRSDTPKQPYRYSIRAYPMPYRDQHGAELIATASEMSGGRWSPRQSLSFLIEGARRSTRTPRRFWGVVAAMPILYGLTQLLSIVAADKSLFAGPPSLVIWGLKSATVVALPILLFLVAERIAARPVRWRSSAALWSGVGVATILVVSRFGATISERVSNDSAKRFWPTGPDFGGERANYHDVVGITDAPSVGDIVLRELVVVVAIAIAAALVMRVCAKVTPLAVVTAALAVFGALVAYNSATPWGFTMDYDFFVGDAVLSGTLMELGFFFSPADPIGAIALGIASLTMSGMILSWGGASQNQPMAGASMTPSPAIKPESALT